MPASHSDHLQALAAALQPAVRAAGAAIMAVHAKGVQAELKDDGSPVTQADRAAEDLLLPALTELAGDIPVISEENKASHQRTAGQRFFLVDPLDGTKEFIRRGTSGAFTVNIGLIEASRPVMGIVYAPMLDRLFIGVMGSGAIEISGGNSASITTRPLPDTGAVALASASHPDPQTASWLDSHQIDQTKAIGSSFKFCLIAAGEADVYPRFGPTMEWDTAAGEAVLRAAGGQMRDQDKCDFRYGKPGWRNGAFQNAIMPSPMYLSTVPPASRTASVIGVM